MIEFGNDLETRITLIAKRVAGTGTESIKTFDDHLHDVDVDQMPFLVVTARTADKAEQKEIAPVSYGPRTWTVHLYYLDTTATFKQGKERRTRLLGKLTKELETNTRLDNLQTTATDGSREYVWNTEITNVLFDYSGEEDYYTFVSELYLIVHTDRN